MKKTNRTFLGLVVISCVGTALGQEEMRTSYMPVVPKEAFSATMSRMKTDKPAVMKRQIDLLQERYDLRNDPASNVTIHTSGVMVTSGTTSAYRAPSESRALAWPRVESAGRPDVG